MQTVLENVEYYLKVPKIKPIRAVDLALQDIWITYPQNPLQKEIVDEFYRQGIVMAIMRDPWHFDFEKYNQARKEATTPKGN